MLKRHGLVRGVLATAVAAGGLLPLASSAVADDPAPPPEVVIPATPRPAPVDAALYQSGMSRFGWADAAGADGVFYADGKAGGVVWTRYADGRSTRVPVPAGNIRATGSDTLAVLRDGEVEFHGADGSVRHLALPGDIKTAAMAFGSTAVAYRMVTQPDGTRTPESTHLLSLRPDGTTRDLTLTGPDGVAFDRVIGGDESSVVVATTARDGQRRIGIASTQTGRVEALTPPVPQSYENVKLSPAHLVVYSGKNGVHDILAFSRKDLSAPATVVPGNRIDPVDYTKNHGFAIVGDWLVYSYARTLEGVPISGGPAVTLLPETFSAPAAGPDGTAAAMGGSDPVRWGVQHIAPDDSGRPVARLVKPLPNPARVEGVALAQGRLSVVDDSDDTPFEYVRTLGASGTPAAGERSRLTDVPLRACADDDVDCAEYRALGDGRFERRIGGYYVVNGPERGDFRSAWLGAGRLVDIDGEYLVHDAADAKNKQQVYSFTEERVVKERAATAAALWGSWLWTPGTAQGTLSAEDLTTGKQVETADAATPCVPKELQAVGRWLYWSCGANGPAGVYDRDTKATQPVPAGEALLGDGYVVTHDIAAAQLVLTGADRAHPVSRVVGALPATGVSQRHIRWSVDRFGGHVAYVDADEQVHVVPTGIAAQPLSVLHRTAATSLAAGEPGADLVSLLLNKPAGAWTVTARHTTTGRTFDVGSGTDARGLLRVRWTGKDTAGQLMPNGQYTWTLTAAPADGTGPALRQSGTVVLTGGLSPATTRFTPVEPERRMDTRTGAGVRKGKVGSGGTVTLKVTDSADVTAVAMNVTATNATASTYVSAYPAGTPRSSASNLNVPAGRTVPNMVVVPVKDGKVTFYNHAGTVDLIADVTGLCTRAAGSLYEPVRPARLLDTRSGLGARKAKVAARTTVPLTVVGRGGLPAKGVTAVVLNVTATDPTASTVVSVVPNATTTAWSGPSVLNVPAGGTVSNLVVAQVRDGRVFLYNHAGSTDLVADVAGYFTDGDLGSLYQPLAPARAMDTRDGTGVRKGTVGPGGTVTLQVTGRGGVPATGVTAVVLNVTATGPTASTYISAYPSGTARTSASNLNPGPGDTVAGLVVVPVIDGKVTFYNHAGTVHLIADVEGFYAP
ncbi:hypothetical protein AB0E88_25825 [Streptomyces sp. NPDC028635]|uniref:hypothetical protein n=1 Tax=Streptomyces sp. NPDC028635 TaxID=3154800 RepID=UPI0033CBA074